MKILHPSKSFCVAVCAALLCTLPLLPTLVPAAEKSAGTVAPPQLSSSLMGTWVHVGAPGKVGEAPAKGGFMKLRTARHWAAVAVDARSGLVTSTHGGTWRVTGNEYEESVEYGNEYHAQWIGKTYKWKVKLEDDLMIKTAVDNPWNEVWKRVK
jgi:hypothetical protein